MSLSSRRAWIEILGFVVVLIQITRSLSSRRAWIEIRWQGDVKTCNVVALLTESVDWNVIKIKEIVKSGGRSPHGERGLKCLTPLSILSYALSLSSRRAWIEIRLDYHSATSQDLVALLTESVDWNIECEKGWNGYKSRSPHGERGLKFGGGLNGCV